jgi:hypothetical protein
MEIDLSSFFSHQQKEIQIHCESELTHEADQLKLQRCLRGQLKSSAEAATILDQSRALQGIPKTERELKAENGKVWSRLFFASLLLSLLFNAIDTGSDILIMIRYMYIRIYRGVCLRKQVLYYLDIVSHANFVVQRPIFRWTASAYRIPFSRYYGEMMGKFPPLGAGNGSCAHQQEAGAISDRDLGDLCDVVAANETYSIQCLPRALSAQQKFGYTLFFILVPWPFFIYEFFTSRQYVQLVTRGGEIVAEMAKCNGFVSFVRAYARAIVYSVTFVCCFLFWPIAVLFIKYYNDGKYYLAKGVQKAEREKKIEASEVLFSTARVMEVSLESSFQPTIQLYIMFPVLVRTMTANYFSFRLFSVCKDESLNFPMLKTDQVP